ncbi:hypothetical protein GCM10027569_92550 [Flindersiella endophytica]
MAGGSLRQGSVALRDAIESAVLAWDHNGQPAIDQIRLKVTDRSHTYWISGVPALSWTHGLV